MRSNHSIRSVTARGFALFLAAFTALGLVARTHNASLDLNLWWVDLRWLPRWLENGCLLTLAILLGAYVAAPRMANWRQWATLLMVGGFVLATFLNALSFWHLAGEGSISSRWPVPLSLLFLTGLLVVLAEVKGASGQRTQWMPTLTCCAVCGIAFPALQCVAFGKTDYRRPAEVAVVFGARVYADGKLSDALADRVRTACLLYQQGVVKRLVFSGGPGDGTVHETAAMTRMAFQLGVPATAIRIDTEGWNTAATVRNTSGSLLGHRVIAVSEFYHLPRIKLAYQCAGIEVFTVPANPSSFKRSVVPASVAREVPAFWAYVARAVIGRL